MKIVIEIPEQKYKWIVDNPQVYISELDEAVRNGIPLGKCDRCGGEIYPNTLCIECNDYLARSVFAEEIKQEIEKIEYLGCPQPQVVIKDILDIIDKHLKGEQE